MSSHPETLLISAVLRKRDHVTPMHGGISNAHFHVHAKEWKWIERFVARYRKTPDKATFKIKFPDFKVKAVDDVAHFTDEVRKEHARFMLTEMLDLVIDMVEKDEVEKAVDALMSGAIKVQGSLEGDSGHFSLFENHALIYDEVKRRVDTFTERGMAGVPSGFTTLDNLTGGGAEGDLWVVGARLGQGKALVNGTGVLTPKGYRAIETLLPGDQIIGSNGKHTSVIGVYPQGERQVLKVNFNDGTVIEACEDHLWNVRVGTKPWKVQTTGQIAKHAGQRFAVPTLSGPVIFNEQRVPYDAYNLGLLLGDGCFRGKMVQFSTADEELVKPFGRYAHHHSNYDYGITGLVPRIKSLRLWGLYSHEKFIPRQYKTSSVKNRLSILQGLFDTDGGATATGGVEYSTTSLCLAKDIQEIVESLGGYSTIKPRQTYCNGKMGEPSYRMIVVLPPSMSPFRLERKLAAWVPRTKYQPTRVITSVEYTDRYEEMTCIAVDAPDSLFVTEHCIVTHNTWALNTMALAAMSHGYTVQYNALEQTKAQIAFRMHTLISAKYGKKIFKSSDLMRGRGFDLGEYKSFLDDISKLGIGHFYAADASRGRITPMTMAAQIELTKPDVVFLDYIQISGNNDKDWQTLGKLSGDLKLLAVRYGVCIITAAQINRMGSGKTPPSVDQIAGSDDIGRDADVVVTLAQQTEHVTRMRLAKARNAQDDVLWYCEFDPSNGLFREVSGNVATTLMDDDLAAADED